MWIEVSLYGSKFSLHFVGDKITQVKSGYSDKFGIKSSERIPAEKFQADFPSLFQTLEETARKIKDSK